MFLSFIDVPVILNWSMRTAVQALEIVSSVRLENLKFDRLLRMALHCSNFPSCPTPPSRSLAKLIFAGLSEVNAVALVEVVMNEVAS